ncbi:ANTAR domain-containing protein [Nocardioides marmoribigeumensis]|uniref:ANTAR domain-containing protein n=1 Tax=Nocardioides marmoribigeumensis TaxID=433649 RepID=A0ABU2C0J8_9ACTN|nr:ANTAR domain-containing protein [Nocardioides marmoribigeumensis]MDR7364163.1 hypothetical protein [Nocardioides marmoribigeumensis]
MTVRSTSQIVAALYDKRVDGTSLTDLLCVDCTSDLSLKGATLSVGDHTGLVAVVGASDPVLRRLEERQVELAEGPAADAARSGAPSVHHQLDDAATARWPTYAPMALEAGVGTIVAWPLSVVAVRVGALAMYAGSPGPLETSGATASVRTWVDAATAILLDLQEAETDPSSVGGLASSLDYTAEIHQATGFVSVTAGVRLDDALELMRARAFATERTLLQVARDVLAARLVIADPGAHDE